MAAQRPLAPQRHVARSTLPRAAHDPRVTLLGRFAVTHATNDATLSSSARRIVALAALHPRLTARSDVAEKLWPDLPASRAKANLRSTLSRLRAACPYLLAPGATAVRLADGVHVDTWEVESIASQLASGGAEAELAETVPIEPLTAELLPGWDDEWVILERDRLRELSLHTLEQSAAGLATQRRFVRAIQTLYEVLRIDSLRESAMRSLIEVHLAEGNQAQAVRCYLSFRQRLRAELGVSPSDSMTGLMSGLRIPRHEF